MEFPLPEKPKPRSRLPILLALVALVALGLASWREYRGARRTWQRAIRSADPLVRNDSWTRLRLDREIPGLDRAGTLREVFAAFDDPDPETRLSAVSTVTSLGADPLDMVPRLARMLRDADVTVRAGAATALGEVVKRAKPGRDEAIAGVSIALKDPEPTVRLAAIAALGQIVYESGDAVDPLRGGRKDDRALDLVAERLGDGDLAVRVESARVLASSGRGEEAVPMLARLIREQPATGPPSHEADRAFLAMMLLAAHSDEAAAFLASEIAETREGYPQRPREALAWAARQSPVARKRVKRLADAGLKSENPTVSGNAALLLHAMGLGRANLQYLIKALENNSVEGRIEVVEGLADIAALGDVDPLIVPALQSATKDANREVRDRAAAALEAIEWAEILSEMEGGL
jgi:HEAT repeat protein